MFFVQALLLLGVIVFYRSLKIYYYTLAVLSSIFALFFIPVILVKEEVNKGILGLLVNTNLRESRELIGWFVIPIILAMLAFFFIALFLLKKLPSKIDFPRAIICSLTGFVVILLFGFKNKPFHEKYADAVSENFRYYFPTKVVVEFRDYYQQTTLYSDKNYQQTMRSFSFGAVKKSQKKPERKIQILVIGEASRYDHWGINGYQRNTSPYLSQEENLIAFSNVTSGAPMTVKSVPMLVSRGGIDNYFTHYKEKGILGAFKEAGYYTAWISNQEPELKLTLFHIPDADTIIFSKNTRGKFYQQNFYDELLIGELKRVIENTNKDICVVLHTMGSHWNYSCRYPPSFQKFPTNLSLNSMLPNYVPRQDMVNAYDNSILYTDYFLDLVINELKSFKSAESSLLYVSDHGENLQDFDNLVTHTDIPNYYSLRVPLFIWLSNDFAENNNKVYNTIIANKDKPVSSAESVFYTLMDLGGITIPSDPHCSVYNLCSEKFEDSKQKVLTLNNTIMFFSELKTEKQWLTENKK
ncbi:phosphoethanolamine transferase [Pinibacter aurantiacus]|uniref:Phosphoethanolamine transferase n=1 Tax=Pinibacter aurantiacus TaxID=2851599 RepID=A0A9E2SE37_9BACT|nr:phosphoethanolamine transferase [Pinibacter aurantiacus]MBV4358315.1 phosphoethanolamine transferase [Pinibacter aurantiacus]